MIMLGSLSYDFGGDQIEIWERGVVSRRSDQGQAGSLKKQTPQGLNFGSSRGRFKSILRDLGIDVS